MMGKDKPRVVVAMSGGVDSSVAAALLVEQGYEVIGMMLRLWSEPGKARENRCCTLDAMNLARRIAGQLGIPFYAVDARGVFYDQVVDHFMSGYLSGVTPNPCLICNRHIRWGFLLNRALALGADYMATGHYANVAHNNKDGFMLLRSADVKKDQTYPLHVLDQDQLSHAIFPIGAYTKEQIRSMAKDFDLPVSNRRDSQDLCFLGNGDYRGFLMRNAPRDINPGPILNSKGEEIGEHTGLPFYTIGQRKGLGISAPQPLYVLEKDIVHNTLIVGTQDELGKDHLRVHDVNWIAGKHPQRAFRAEVKIRYQSQEVWGSIHPLDFDKAHIQFDEALRDITPGQAAVFYQGEVCLGGGIID